MKTLINIFFTTVFVMLLAHLLPGVHVHNYMTALLVALVLGLLNIFVKPLLVLFTLPATIFTLGLSSWLSTPSLSCFAMSSWTGFA